MEKLNRENLWSLEQYAEVRSEFRAEVMAHKRPRRVQIGPHATLYFEDFLTMKYQVQEMLRAERIFEAAGINEEIDAYNPLIPDGSNLKATFMIEYDDVTERRAALAKLAGIEDTVWVQAEGGEKVYAIANEDLDRSNEDKTSAVHFLRFELGPDTIGAFKQGRKIAFGIDHEGLAGSVTLTPEQTASLAADLD
ncbi:MAG: DUF3501 family protein [Pseudomonadales bacterium]|jgi:hypothetical protein